eukprot:223973-Prorocentrum_minimum.AAC.2
MPQAGDAKSTQALATNTDAPLWLRCLAQTEIALLPLTSTLLPLTSTPFPLWLRCLAQTEIALLPLTSALLPLTSTPFPLWLRCLAQTEIVGASSFATEVRKEYHNNNELIKQEFKITI